MLEIAAQFKEKCNVNFVAAFDEISNKYLEMTIKTSAIRKRFALEKTLTVVFICAKDIFVSKPGFSEPQKYERN